MKNLPQLSVPDMPAEGLPPCLDRRGFLANTGLFAVGALLASACGDGQLGGTGPTPGATPGPTPGASGNSVTVNPADYPALAMIGGVARLNGTSRPVALVRSSATAYRAFSMICPHQGTTIDVVNANTSFRCPNHGAEFASSGRRTGGQVTSDLVELQVEGNASGSMITVRY